MTPITLFKNKFKENPYSYLFGSIIILFLIDPLIPGQNRILVAFYLLLIMLSAVLTLRLKKQIRSICLSLGLAAFVLTAINVLMGQESVYRVLDFFTLLSYIIFFLITIIIFLRKIFFSSNTTWDSVNGGISLYFLLGIFWTFLYQLVLLFDPRAITFHTPAPKMSDTLYFSFTTLTTLGYGDNLPISDMAKNLTILESTLGQIFLTVLVARLVGQHLAQSLNTNK